MEASTGRTDPAHTPHPPRLALPRPQPRTPCAFPQLPPQPIRLPVWGPPMSVGAWPQGAAGPHDTLTQSAQTQETHCVIPTEEDVRMPTQPFQLQTSPLVGKVYDPAPRTTLYLGVSFPLELSIQFQMFIQWVSHHSQVQLLTKLSIFNIYFPSDYSASALEIAVSLGTCPDHGAKRFSSN